MWTIFLKLLLNLLPYCFSFLFWFFGWEACGVLVPWLGIEPTPSALEGEVLATGPPGKFPNRVLVPPLCVPALGDAGHHWTLFRLLCFLLSLLLWFMNIMYMLKKFLEEYQRTYSDQWVVLLPLGPNSTALRIVWSLSPASCLSSQGYSLGVK